MGGRNNHRYAARPILHNYELNRKRYSGVLYVRSDAYVGQPWRLTTSAEGNNSVKHVVHNMRVLRLWITRRPARASDLLQRLKLVTSDVTCFFNALPQNFISDIVAKAQISEFKKKRNMFLPDRRLFSIGLLRFYSSKSIKRVLE